MIVTLSTPRDLFIHELSDTMSAEHIVLKMLGEMAELTENAEAKKAAQDHQKETEQQIKNLDKIFKLLGEKPEDTTCHAAEGLKKELDSLKEEKPEGNVKELGLLAGAGKTEHYEIASYVMLESMAKNLGETDVAELLKENLDQEKEMARAVESLAREVGREVKAEMKQQEKEAKAASAS
jgi:ferritin-like metal-binding protein YciE